MPLVADDRIVRAGLVAAAGAVAASVLLGLLGDPWRTAVAAGLAVLLVAVGSPHGALDHLVLVSGPVADGEVQDPRRRATLARWLDAARAPLRGLGAGLVAGYAGLALLSLLAYLAAPRAGFALFLVLSVAHFAAGEAGVAVDRGLARGWLDPRAWVAALGGAVVVVLPLASPEAAAAVAAVDPRLAPVLGPLDVLAPVVAAAVVVALLGCLVAALRGDRQAPVLAVELMVLGALSVLADPLLAFAAYFAFWHSLRHQARLAQVLRGPGGGPLARHVGRPLREVVSSALAGVPAAFGVVVGAGVLALTGSTLLGGLLAVIWALTVPHSIAVVVLEVRSARARRRGAEQVTATSGRGTGLLAVASKGHDDDPTPGPADVGPPPPARSGPAGLRG